MSSFIISFFSGQRTANDVRLELLEQKLESITSEMEHNTVKIAQNVQNIEENAQNSEEKLASLTIDVEKLQQTLWFDSYRYVYLDKIFFFPILSYLI